MSRKIRDGIIIDENIYTIDDTTQGIPSYMRVVQVLAVMLGAWSVVGMFVQGFSVPVLTAQVSLTIFIGGIILSLMALWESYDLYKAPIFLILYALFLRLTFAQFQNGFFLIENLVIKQLNSYFGLQILQYTANYTSATKDTTLIINFVVVIILALLSMAIFRNKMKHLCYVIMLIPVASCFIIGIIPKEKYLIVYLIVTIYLAKMHGSRQHYMNDEQKQISHKISIRTAMFLSMMSFVLFLVTKLIVNPIQYNDLVNVKEVKSEIQTALFEFNLEEFSTKLKNYGIQVGTNRNVATGGLDGGKLGKVDEVIFNETEQLHLTAPYISVASGIFLKGYVGSVYTGDSWGGLTKEMKLKYQELIENLPDQGYTPMDQTTLLLGYISKFRDQDEYYNGKQIWFSHPINRYNFYKGVVKIDYINANKKFLYVPYQTEYNLQEIEFVQDLYAAPVSRRDHYELEYYFNISLNDMETLLSLEDKPDWLDKYEETEKKYREYVYDVYTKLPTNGVDRLIREFSLPAEEYNSSKIMEQIAYIKDYLNENTTYTLSPGRLPGEKDFVEYFLYESQKGYCSHYASAATLMLRAMGIPARYVEGYSVDSQNILYRNRLNNETVQLFTNQEEKKMDLQMVNVVVKDSNAHAWVEVYLDGTGWFPMEFTPGANINNTSSLAQDMILFQEEITRSRENWEEKIDPTELPEMKNDEIQTEKNEVEQPKDKAINDDQGNEEAEVDQKQKEGEFGNTIVLRLIIMLLVILFVTVFYKYYLVIQKKIRLQKAKNPSKKALLLYSDIDKLLRVCKAIPKVDNSFDDMVAHVEKYCPYITDGSFSSCMKTILKARFSKRSISLEELREVESFYSNLKDMVYQDSSFGKKVYLKLI